MTSGGQSRRLARGFILAALLDGPLHGYDIMKRAEQMSGGRVRLANRHSVHRPQMAEVARMVTEADRGAAVRPVRSRRQVRPA